MSTYQPPLNDMQFVIEELSSFDALMSIPGFDELDHETVGSILEEAGKLATDVLEPCNAAGDQIGAQIDGDNVIAAPGFGEAYQEFVNGGWPSLAAAPEFGGQGLPALLSFAVDELVNSSNLSFSLCPMLTQAAVEALEIHGSTALKDTYLPNLISGQWTGTMDLTEPQAGSDLAAIRCQALPEGDHYRLKGTKIYISWGDHSMAENIIHMVLARLPDAPDGVRGISLFLVPKFVLNDDGTPGPRNDFKPVSIEHKMGIHGSPTCVLQFGANEGALGYLIGEPNKGLMYMFTMMNNARLKVGLEGLGISERAYQHARAWAFERVQGRPPGGTDTSPIAGHPDVRRMLMLQKSITEAMRVMIYTTAADTDLAQRAPDEDQRAHHQARVDLMVPIVKTWCTELSQEVASLGIQIYGGMGYIEETGATQFYRDARITTIYEGTTGIQAQDFAGRKIIRDSGRAVYALCDEIEDTILQLGAADMNHEADALTQGLASMRISVAWLLDNYADDQFVTNSACYNLLMNCSTVVAAWGLARGALAAQRRLKNKADGTRYLQGKISTARFFFDHVLPRALSFGQSACAASDTVMGLADDQF
ncbi:MAG: acyl-CoA dehydrogenase [Gammaproteobacteria bacterium]|nr:acyl-CoA dehydrogenase [Gammaproteobacteria bacterium]